MNAGSLSLSLLLPFGAVLLSSLVIAARRTRSVVNYFVAGSQVTATQNALVLAGDFVGVGGFFAIAGIASLHDERIRILAAVTQLVLILVQLTAQLVGAMALL